MLLRQGGSSSALHSIPEPAVSFGWDRFRSQTKREFSGAEAELNGGQPSAEDRLSRRADTDCMTPREDPRNADSPLALDPPALVGQSEDDASTALEPAGEVLSVPGAGLVTPESAGRVTGVVRESHVARHVSRS
jgi:hypothetical protein